MEIFLAILFLLIGIVLIVFGGNFFVGASINIAKKTKIPEIIIGATIVSLATTMPEFIVSVLSAAKGFDGLAIGNSVGTVVCNTALIGGIGLCLTRQNYDKKESFSKFYILLFLTILLLILSLNKSLGIIEGVGLVVLGIAFLGLNFFDAKKQASYAEKNMIEQKPKEAQPLKADMPWWKIALFFILGAAGIAFGAYLLVQYGSKLARLAGISETIVGILILGVGTSLPELVTTIISVKKKSSGLGIGNIVGANILNLTLILGVSALACPGGGLTIDMQTLCISIPISILVSALFVLPIICRKKTFKWQGVFLLIVYLLYVIILLIGPKFG
ncbi:MAG: calcium/sodium antiporter [Clostridia bacterium]